MVYPRHVTDRRVSACFLLLVAAALIAGPGATLYAASPCNTGAPMDCCSGDGDGGAPPPCGCSLSPVAPSPTIAETGSPAVVLAEAPLLALAGPDPVPAVPQSPVTPRARAAPLFVLFVTFLN